ncbi:MAG: histidine kinase, partial [Saprospiraceae bacterium]
KICINLKNQIAFFDKHFPDSPLISGKVILEDVQLFNQNTNWNSNTDSLCTYFQLPQNLHLNYNQNTLTFFYNSPSIFHDEDPFYSYRLLPADTAWSKLSENKSVSFSQLKPATYSFQVRSRQTGMEWSDITNFSFMIQKPFWDRTWFRIIILLGVASLVACVFRIRLKQERKKGEIKSQLLELEMRALRAQMNPHFIYNALNSIQSLVATNQTMSANKYISKFARLLRQVLENSKRSEISLSQELESLRLYVDLEKLRLDEDVKFIETMDESIVPETIRIPPLVLQPFVENALWHGLSSKEGEKRIELVINDDKEWVHFSITDNGIGRQKAAMSKPSIKEHESTAVSLTGQRLVDFNGTVKPDALKMEDLFAPDGSAIGTRVWLHIRKKTSPGFTAQ